MTGINKQIVLSSDDGQEVNDTTFDSESTWFGHDAGGSYDLCLRWQSLDIPWKAIIVSAKISIDIDLIFGYDLEYTIKGIDEDNTPTWSQGNRASQRVKTTSEINADSTSWNNTLEWGWNTIDITSILQEIVDRDGWEVGNALGIAIENDLIVGNKARTCRFYPNSNSAKLEIEYHENYWIPALASIIR